MMMMMIIHHYHQREYAIMLSGTDSVFRFFKVNYQSLHKYRDKIDREKYYYLKVSKVIDIALIFRQ